MVRVNEGDKVREAVTAAEERVYGFGQHPILVGWDGEERLSR